MPYVKNSWIKNVLANDYYVIEKEVCSASNSCNRHMKGNMHMVNYVREGCSCSTLSMKNSEKKLNMHVHYYAEVA